MQDSTAGSRRRDFIGGLLQQERSTTLDFLATGWNHAEIDQFFNPLEKQIIIPPSRYELRSEREAIWTSEHRRRN